MIELTALQQNIIKNFKDIITRYFNKVDNNELAIIMAQIEAETSFVNFEEKFNYSLDELTKMFGHDEAVKLENNPVAIANYMYNGRMGNQVGTDDGYKFRGRGLFMLTGRDNYMLCAEHFKLFKGQKQNVDDFIINFLSVGFDDNNTIYPTSCRVAYWIWFSLFKRPATIDDATYAINGIHASLETLNIRRHLNEKWLEILGEL